MSIMMLGLIAGLVCLAGILVGLVIIGVMAYRDRNK
jgi:hypothetical protein